MSEVLAMRIFVIYNRVRMTVDIEEDRQVQDVKEMIRDYFSLGPDNGPSGVEGQVRKTLAISFFGSVLNDRWLLSDVGVLSSSTLRAFMKDEVKPVLYLHTKFNKDTIPLLQKINMHKWTVKDLRSLATRHSGIPISVFRMVNKEGKEMFDYYTLDEYNLRVTDTITLETWNGWNDFLYLATKGITANVMERLSSDELEQRYQMKVALYISAHFGHVDLAATLMKPGSSYPHIRQDIRPDEPVGEHPERMWCTGISDIHPDALKTPVHEAAEFGQLGVLHLFVTSNICNVLARDSRGLTPLNLALRSKQKACASFLLTKQWSKVSLVNNPKVNISLKVYVKMKKWADQAKDKVLITHGQTKSSVRNTGRQVQHGALVGQGVLIDGFSKSKMDSKPIQACVKDKLEEGKKSAVRRTYEDARKNGTGNTKQFFESLSLKMSRSSKKRTLKKRKGYEDIYNKALDDIDARSSCSTENTSSGSPDLRLKAIKNSLGNGEEQERLKLPPIHENLVGSKGLSKSDENLTKSSGKNIIGVISKSYIKFKKLAGSAFIETGLENRTKMDDINKAATATMQNKSKKKENVVIEQNNDLGISLPVVSTERSLRPFFMAKKDNPITRTMEEYTSYRGGIDSRDYAIKCMSIVSSCHEKPWLQQVRQAMFIAGRNVRRSTEQRPQVLEENVEPSSFLSNVSDDMLSMEGSIIST